MPIPMSPYIVELAQRAAQPGAELAPHEVKILDQVSAQLVMNSGVKDAGVRVCPEAIDEQKQRDLTHSSSE